MKLISKKVLLASAAVAVMGVATPAFAFDTVNWEWDKTITETVNVDATITLDTTPSGMTQIEKLQAFIGDVTATSTVTNITNTPPGELIGEGGVIQVEDFFNIQTTTDDSTDPTTINPAPGVFGSNLVLQVELLGGTFDEGSDELDMDFRVFGDVDLSDLIELAELDAADLPKVESFATAVGNNQNIESSASVQLHDAQLLFGGFTEGGEGDLETLLSSLPDLDNTHTEAALALTLGAALGLIEASEVSAVSEVSAIENASVESEATAIANNMSVELAAFTPADALVLADVTQFAMANVTATSTVDEINVLNYTGFGLAGMGPCGGCENVEDLAQIPLISSKATAIGNNFSVTVSSPEVEVEAPGNGTGE